MIAKQKNMSRFSKIAVLATMKRTGMVPVFYNADVEISKRVLKACYDGGVRAFEFTNRGDFAHEIFGELNRWAAAECPEMILGAGSVVDAPTAKVCNRRCIPYTPGCGSVSEIGFAQEAGCDLTKIFPAGNVGGPSFVKNIKAPMPWSMLMATGAVEPTEENLAAWFKAGVTVVGMGSKLFPKEIVAAGDWQAVSDLCRRALDIIARARG